MSIGAITSLRDVRQNLLGFSLEGVARLTMIPLSRLVELEQSSKDISVWEAETLAHLYGIDSEILASEPLRVPQYSVVAALASADEFHMIGDNTRARVVAAARAARDIASLRQLLGIAQPVVPIIRVDVTAIPHQDGKVAAQEVRSMLGPQTGAILSIRDWLREQVPGVALLYAHLGANGPAALAFASWDFGPALVLNMDGKNENPCVRRFSLAHEIYHLLADWQRAEPLATLSGYIESDSKFAREQRANSFATRLICPEQDLTALAGRGGDEAIRKLIVTWGLHYSAARLYLLNVLNVHLPHPSAPELRGLSAEIWQDAERPLGFDGFPLASVPTERRTLVAQLAAEAYVRALIPRDAFAEYLDVPPSEDLERVIDFFGMDLPDRGPNAAA